MTEPAVDYSKYPGIYWNRYYRRLSSLLKRFAWLALNDKIDPIYVEQLKIDLLNALEMVEEREKRDAVRARIEALERTEGRTPEESALYRAKAEQLRDATR
jgi:hypothetical protein